MLYNFCVCLELLPAPQKRARVNFSKAFHDGGCAAFPLYVVCLTLVRIWCPGILKIYLI